MSDRPRTSGRVLAVIPVHGHHEMTHDLLDDLAREADLVDVVVVDNRGDYLAHGAEEVLRPGVNLGWAGGTNLGTLECRTSEHLGFVWLNNDTRLCAAFIAGLIESWQATGAGVLAPFYDCYWQHQRPTRTPPVDEYLPRRVYFRARFVDGTCMFVPASTVDRIGVLDADTFAPIGWGAEIDYGLRARAAGLRVVVTGLAYLHHDKSTTGKTAFAGGLQEYAERGYPVLMDGLRRKWGEDWQRQAGIDPATNQTTRPRWRTRLLGPRRRRTPPLS